MDTLKAKIRHVPDFPKAGILFYDITTLLNDAQGFRDMIDALSKPYVGQGVEQVVGIESRGFILGAAVANTLNAGFVPIRKPGKLPSAATCRPSMRTWLAWSVFPAPVGSYGVIRSTSAEEPGAAWTVRVQHSA